LSNDWFDDKYAEARKAMQADAIENAKAHELFVTDPRAKKLLKLWKHLADVRVQPGASLDYYARAEALRSFVKTIEEQIEIAKQHT